MATSTIRLSLTMAFFILLPTSNCAKILFMAHFPARSHFDVFEPIIEGLAARRHEIVVQSYHKPKTHSNVKLLQLSRPEYLENFKIDLEEESSKDAISRLRTYFPLATQACQHLLTDESTAALVSEGKQFDLVIIDELYPECAVSVGSMLAKNTMYLSTGLLTPWLPAPVPAPPSYVPNSLEPLPLQLSFWHRWKNVFALLATKYVWQHELVPAQQALVSKYFPLSPGIEEAHHQVAFRLTNADDVMQSARPTMYTIAHCGGVHCTQPKPLPEDLNKFVESSGSDGFILVSIVKPEMMTSEFKQEMMSAFGRLKQKVIWKLESHKLDDVPKNVQIIKGAPQQDLLGHPNIRLFITHAGLLNLQEAIFHGVPVIAIPLFAEQPANADRIQNLGIGETISFRNLTADGLYEVITRMLKDKSYKENVRQSSAIFRDQPARPVDKAVFWVEYVIRHNGARHFRSEGDDLNFFQYFLLDIAAALLLLACSVLGIIVYCLRLLLRKCSAVQNKVKKDDVKKKNK